MNTGIMPQSISTIHLTKEWYLIKGALARYLALDEMMKPQSKYSKLINLVVVVLQNEPQGLSNWQQAELIEISSCMCLPSFSFHESKNRVPCDISFKHVCFLFSPVNASQSAYTHYIHDGY